MKVATILPTPLLGQEPATDYNMCLFHMVRDNEEYAKYFRTLRDQGKFVIMDNGAAEGVNPSPAELAAVYKKVQPSEIVLPDIVYDKEETLRRTKEAYIQFCDEFMHQRYQFMAVPQGETFHEWLSCMTEMMQQRHITTIGVSKFVTPKYQEEMGKGTNVRLECVDAIITEAARLGVAMQIHLLGCWDNPAEVGEIDRAFGDRVRGTDSAIAYVYTRAGKIYTPDINRPDNTEIDFNHGSTGKGDVGLLQQNMNSWIKYCQA